ncbi:xyloglucan endo-transglycosylase [Fusarium agapanthi]|uniref:Xyloglucan endo-transglycosylase n=1 Tax=Fusarium agapanthi TaxID=1803897 RepID=A0A9P5B6L9_9HYPO|nr:xyloglucan endo-transglycosylase [Fusarium agapanthi]
MILPLTHLLATARLLSGACECGYSITNSQGDSPMVFSDRLETKFSQLHTISEGHDWVAQNFTVSAANGRGNFSKAFLPNNVNTHETKSGDDSGLELRYFNDTQEIDIEFLSQEFDHDNGIYPINLVVQSKKSLEAGYDASKTGSFKRVKLDFDPTDAFHEYRFDYLPGQVLFYADGKLLAHMKGADMPSSGGHLILQHWSNGNPLWSGGPPKEDATVTVSYVKAYFNSSNSERQSQLARRCHESSEETSVLAQ